MCIPKRGDLIGAKAEEVSYVRDKDINLNGIHNRAKLTPDFLPNDCFRVTTYNLLADFYTDSEYSRTELFPYCPPEYLHIDYRRKLWIQELIKYKSDIYCLQELDKDMFHNDFTLCLSHLNYGGVFLKKPTISEGVAIFYNKNKFR